ncbi:response regulator transcription factor [Arthrobacter sp. I2-34]|uniref:Response regulator transcription factor n=1 Tax=Arthrobacter hankyongi TaxID=2904801 RepID=A0ABS9L1H2_9MICC|nr:response regulator transcription factor [Arthrobacter hankyongi]MCG2620488.1 response regulator transcription factor [Arthrobacter hankyongi]
MADQRVAVVVEDDADIRDLISVVLGSSGFEVVVAPTGTAGIEAVREHRPAIITLDLSLPDIDGFEVARQVRQFSDAYIIMLTARAEELDTLLGLESGADDYLTKPFRPRELRARVTAMLRRPRSGQPATSGPDVRLENPAAAAPVPVPEAAPVSAPAAPVPGYSSPVPAPAEAGAPEGILEHNGLTINRRSRRATIGGATVDLTRTEFDLLDALMEGGRVVRSKAELARRVKVDSYDGGAYGSAVNVRTIDVHMANLRRKLGEDPELPRWIKTVGGVGYCLAPKRG